MYILLINENLYKYVSEISDILLTKKYKYIKIKNNSINKKYMKFDTEIFEDTFVYNDIEDIFDSISQKYNINCDYLLYKELTRKQILL